MALPPTSTVMQQSEASMMNNTFDHGSNFSQAAIVLPVNNNQQNAMK